jgi:chromate transporter
VIAVFVLIWALALAGLVATGGRDGELPAMAWFFTKAAMLTFGGAYAVLPYVYQGAVEQHGWLTATQMMDGLALGETTPGPLIMVVAFVGFVGGWTHAAGTTSAGAGWAGAATATLFTFLPSFLFILAGGPLVEATRGSLRYTAPLTGVTAAVVGVIVNLALFFAWHVLWPDPAQAGTLAGLDGVALAIGVAAGFALLRARAGVVPVIAGAACAGLAVTLLRSGALRGLLPGFAA